jgi:uncharacterized protein
MRMNVETEIFEKAALECARQFRLPIDSIHGMSHWRRVREIGMYLASLTNADTKVVALFSCIHDSQRDNEDDDPMHGVRAVRYARDLYDRGLLKINEKQLEQLVFACANHSDRDAVSHDSTVQTCWDADRLDLYRLGETPDDNFLYTHAAKTMEVKDFASGLSVGN